MSDIPSFLNQKRTLNQAELIQQVAKEAAAQENVINTKIDEVAVPLRQEIVDLRKLNSDQSEKINQLNSQIETITTQLKQVLAKAQSQSETIEQNKTGLTLMLHTVENQKVEIGQKNVSITELQNLNQQIQIQAQDNYNSGFAAGKSELEIQFAQLNTANEDLIKSQQVLQEQNTTLYDKSEAYRKKVELNLLKDQLASDYAELTSTNFVTEVTSNLFYPMIEKHAKNKVGDSPSAAPLLGIYLDSLKQGFDSLNYTPQRMIADIREYILSGKYGEPDSQALESFFNKLLDISVDLKTSLEVILGVEIKDFEGSSGDTAVDQKKAEYDVLVAIVDEIDTKHHLIPTQLVQTTIKMDN